MSDVTADLSTFMDWVSARNRGETEFLQAVHEVAATILPFVHANPIYREQKDSRAPDRARPLVAFRVVWEADDGEVHVNRGYRVQFSNAIGPYKGGIRFHPSVNQLGAEIPRLRADFQEFA